MHAGYSPECMMITIQNDDPFTRSPWVISDCHSASLTFFWQGSGSSPRLRTCGWLWPILAWPTAIHSWLWQHPTAQSHRCQWCSVGGSSLNLSVSCQICGVIAWVFLWQSVSCHIYGVIAWVFLWLSVSCHICGVMACVFLWQCVMSYLWNDGMHVFVTICVISYLWSDFATVYVISVEWWHECFWDCLELYSYFFLAFSTLLYHGLKLYWTLPVTFRLTLGLELGLCTFWDWYNSCKLWQQYCFYLHVTSMCPVLQTETSGSEWWSCFVSETEHSFVRKSTHLICDFHIIMCVG